MSFFDLNLLKSDNHMHLVVSGKRLGKSTALQDYCIRQCLVEGKHLILARKNYSEVSSFIVWLNEGYCRYEQCQDGAYFKRGKIKGSIVFCSTTAEGDLEEQEVGTLVGLNNCYEYKSAFNLTKQYIFVLEEFTNLNDLQNLTTVLYALYRRDSTGNLYPTFEFYGLGNMTGNWYNFKHMYGIPSETRNKHLKIYVNELCFNLLHYFVSPEHEQGVTENNELLRRYSKKELHQLSQSCTWVASGMGIHVYKWLCFYIVSRHKVTCRNRRPEEFWLSVVKLKQLRVENVRQIELFYLLAKYYSTLVQDERG